MVEKSTPHLLYVMVKLGFILLSTNLQNNIVLHEMHLVICRRSEFKWGLRKTTANEQPHVCDIWNFEHYTVRYITYT